MRLRMPRRSRRRSNKPVVPAFAGTTKWGVLFPSQRIRGELERRDEMRVGLGIAAEAAEHLSQCEVRSPRIVHAQACLEIGLRLAPQLLTLAERPQHAQQHCVLVVRNEPAFRLLE